MTAETERALRPEDLTRLFVERANAGDAEGLAEGAAQRAIEHGLREVEVFVKGPGAGREAAVRALQSSGVRVLSIRDVTPIPHNGCRPRRRPRQ